MFNIQVSWSVSSQSWLHTFFMSSVEVLSSVYLCSLLRFQFCFNCRDQVFQLNSKFNKSYMYTASVPLPNGCPLIYRLCLGHLLPHRYSCKTDCIDIPLLGDVKWSSIVCMTKKLEEFPDADCDDTECLSSILRSIKNLLLLFPKESERCLVHLSRWAGFQSSYKHQDKNKHHECRTLTTCLATKILLPDLWNVSNFPQWFNEIDHSAGISGYSSITMAAKMSMANY